MFEADHSLSKASSTVPGGVARCAPWTRATGLDPVGTAGSQLGYVLVDWPLPWPRDVKDIDELNPLRRALDAGGCRLQLLVPQDGEGARRVILYRRTPDRLFAGFTRHHVRVAAHEVVTVALELVLGAGRGPTPSGGAGVDADRGSHHDVLVCTHGRRDRCCGAFGTELAAELSSDPEQLGSGTAVSRTSHTGGHRYAPTALVFPEGTAWAFAGGELLAQVVQRRGSIGEVLRHYRGCVGLGSPAVQAVERTVLGEVGWSMWDLPRQGEELGGGRVRLDVEGLDGPGTVATWEAMVSTGRTIPMPDCGGPSDVVRATASELVVTNSRRLA